MGFEVFKPTILSFVHLYFTPKTTFTLHRNSIFSFVKTPFWFGLLSVVLIFQSAAAQERLTLQQAIDIALQNNYSIRIVRNQQLISENDYRLGRGSFLPTVNATAQTNNNYNYLYRQERQTIDTSNNVQTITSDFSGRTNNSLSAALTMNWLIYDGGAMFTNYKRLEELRAAGRDNTEIIIENTIASVTNAYFNIIQQEQRRGVLEDALKISQERLRLAKNRYEVGSGSRQEYLSAQVDYNTDQSALITQEQLVANAKIIMNQLLARSPESNIVASDSMLVNASLNLGELQTSVEKQNPSLLFAQRNKNISYLDAKIANSGRLPQVNLFSGLSRTYQNSRAGLFPNVVNSGVLNYGATVTIPILNGNLVNRQVQVARVNQQSAEFQYEDAKNQVLADLQTAYVSYTNSLKLIELERQNVEVAQQNVTIALERYKTGVTTSLEVRDVQRNAVAANSRLIDAIYNAKLSETELMRLSSQIVQ